MLHFVRNDHHANKKGAAAKGVFDHAAPPLSHENVLRDSHNRIHSYLRLSITDRCNFRCRYCMPAEGIEQADRSKILRPEEIGRLAQIFAQMGVRKLRVTGGEPLVRRGLDVILDHLAAIQPPLQLAITTNGFWLSPWLERLASARVGHINVSLDTLKPERFVRITGFAGWQRAWDGMQAALQHPQIVRVKLNVVLQRGINDDEIEDFAALTLRYPLDVRFIELMSGGRVSFGARELISSAEVLARLGEIEEVGAGESIAGPAKRYKLPGAVGEIGLISGESCPACSGCNRMRLTAKGELLRCLFDPVGLDLRKALRSARPEESISQQIQNYLVGKAEMGRPGIFASEPRRFSPCLAQVGG